MQKEKEEALQNCERMENDKVRTERQLQETSAQVCIHSVRTNHKPINNSHWLWHILLLQFKKECNISRSVGASVSSDIAS